MKVLLIALMALTTCVGCHKKTVEDCKADYKEELKQCDKDEEACDKAAKMQKDKCKAITDPAKRDKCLQDAKAAQKACDDAKDQCIKDAKKDRDSCKQNAAPSK
jgi:hypothetical protein